MRIQQWRTTALTCSCGALLLFGCASVPDSGRRAGEPSDSDVIAALPDESRSEALQSLYRAVQEEIRSGHLQGALDIVEDAPSELRESPDVAYLHANLLLSDGQVHRALELLKEIAELPEHLEPEHLEPDGPSEAPARSAASDRENVAVAARLLIAAMTVDSDGRAAAWQRVLDLDADNAQARAGLGHALLEAGDNAGATEQFAMALSVDESLVSALLGKAYIAENSGDREEQVRWLERAVRSEPDAGLLASELGHALVAVDRRDDAIESFTAAIELEPESAWHRVDRGRVHQRAGTHDRALEDFDRAIELNPEIFLFYYYRANSRFNSDDFDGALRDYERVVAAEPTYSDAYAPLATLYFRTERYRDAAEYFVRTYDRVSRDPSFQMLAALSYLRAGERSRADLLLRDVERLSDRSSLYYDMAREYQSPRRDSRTEGLIRRESNRNMQTRMRFYLGALYHLEGRERAAEMLFHQVLDAGDTGFVESELAGVYLEAIERARSGK